MAFALKELDDRTWQSLVDEAKRRIVTYLPEWTDHNESDPGITLVQLFAWLTETAIFRMNQVPDDRMYLAFLNLLGLSPAAAKPAEAVVVLDMRPGAPPGLYQPFELRFSAPGGPTGEIGFEPDAPVPTIGASLAMVLVDDEVSPGRLDVTDRNEAGDDPYAPFGSTSIPGRALYLGLSTVAPGGGTPGPLVPTGSSAELQIYVRVDEVKMPLVPASTSFGEAVASIESDLVWQASGPGGSWIDLQVEQDETRGMTRSGLVRLKLADDIQTVVVADDDRKRPLFWVRARVQSSAPETRSIRYLAINAARVRQWTTYVNELLVPGSDGAPRQHRDVRHAPILADDGVLVVEVNEPDENGNLKWIPWSRTDDLASRLVDGVVQPGDRPLRVFRLKPDRSGIEFGDGLAGLIPPRGVNNLRVTYRSGGGALGNVSAGKIQLAVSKPDIEGARQLEAATGGVDEEAIADAVDDAPGRIRAVERAVTASDFEVLAKQVAGVARASALNRYHPLYPDVPVTGAISLVVIPPPTGEDRAPLPNQPFLDAVARALEPYRVLTTELFVLAPRYRDVTVEVDLEVRREVDAPEARANVTRAIAAFFDPIRGGRDGGGWPLGGAIVYGELLGAVLAAGKVAAVRALTISLDGVAQAACADVPLAPEGAPSIDLVRAAPAILRVSAPSPRR